MWTRTTQHALRAMIAIAQQDGEGFVTAKSVSEMLDLPPSFLAKVLQRLTVAGLLVSLRGPRGGVTLAKPAEAIRLIDIIEAADGKMPYDDCLFGWPGCTRTKPCPLHREWGAALQHVSDFLQSTTLADSARLASDGTAVDRRFSAMK